MRKMLLALLCLCGSLAHAQSTDDFDGRPAFSGKELPAYYIWRDGNRWHVRWSSLTRVRYFTGSILADSSSLSDLRKVDPYREYTVMYPQREKLLTVTLGDRHPAGLANDESFSRNIRMKGKQMIVFSSNINDGVDGFDFTTTEGVHTLTFDLMIEGKPALGIVYVGSEGTAPNSLPLVVAVKR